MLSRKFIIALLIAAVLGLTSMQSFLTVQTTESCGCGVPCWCKTIMDNTEISGLINVGESQSIEYIGMSNWNNYDVCNYLVWRWHNGGEKRDLQAHIELAKLAEGVYKMEIYHSWSTLSISMPYSYTILLEEPLALVIRIEADICQD